MKKSVSVIGLGKLGLSLASVFASKGYNVIGVDVKEHVVDTINKKKCHITEPEVAEVVKIHGGKTLKATLKHKDAIRNSDISFIVTQTPSKHSGMFDSRYLENACEELGHAFAGSGKTYHLFVIVSTTFPGQVEEVLIPILEKYSGRKCGKGFGVVYSPEFVHLGSVFDDFLRPEYYVIGELSSKDGDFLLHYMKVWDSVPVIHRMGIKDAEITKITLNAYITMKMSFANMVGNLCECIPETDVDAILKAVGTDSRVGTKFFKAGPRFGGECFPRDVGAFREFSKQIIYDDCLMMRSVAEINTKQDQVLREFVKRPYRYLRILGTAFKPGTDVMTEGAVKTLMEHLPPSDGVVCLFDRLAQERIKELYGTHDHVRVHFSSALECLKYEDPDFRPRDRNLLNDELWTVSGTTEEPLKHAPDFVIVAHPEMEFKAALEQFKPRRETIVLDCWRILDEKALDKRIKVKKWGYAMK